MELQMIDLRGLPVMDGEVAPPSEVVVLDEMTYASWGKQLSLPQYLQRERRLRACAFSLGGLCTWVLREGDAVLASCESYTVPLSLLGPGGGQRGVAHGIASVFVEAQRRGRGHASALLTQLHARLRAEGVACCYLMSEIGPTLYQRLGYVARPLWARRLAAADPHSAAAPPPAHLVQADEVPALLAARERAAQRGALAIPVTAAQIDWHLQRGQFYAQVLQRPPLPAVGARSGEAWALWAPDYVQSVLRVLLLYPGPRLHHSGAAPDPHSAEAADLRNVLHSGRAVAARLGLAHLETWENPHNASWLRGGARALADDLPMLLPLQTGVRAEDWTDFERAHWL